MRSYTLFIYGISLLISSSSVFAQTSTATSTSGGLQLLTTVGIQSTSTSGSVSGTASQSVSSNSTRSSNSTTTGTGTAATQPGNGIDPATAVPSQFPSNAAFINGPLTSTYLITAVGLAGFAALGL